MRETINLASEIRAQLPNDLVEFMEKAGRTAARAGQKLHLVGGVVRDLLLGRPNLDLDLVVEGDAVTLARRLAGKGTKLTVHPAFRTAKLLRDRWSVDFTTARSETYSRPGALPQVEAGTLESDLFRRDFTVNAMAVELTSGHYGDLVDLHGGINDLKKRAIRVLHDRSFSDDATRMWRAARYEQRLSFRIEPTTRGLLERDLAMLDTISGDRIRHEIELSLKEGRPEKVLRRAYDLGILAKLHPSLKADAWLARKFRQARESGGEAPLPALYWAILAYRLQPEETERLIVYLRLPRHTAQLLRDSASINATLEQLARPGLRPSQIYYLLKDLTLASVAGARVAAESRVARDRLELYLAKLRRVKTAITGVDLIRMGLEPGPRMKEVLSRLRQARLDGDVATREEEAELAETLIGTN
jgi:tRNA nucleotidyltransferase (CCA-adding enzyme)